MNSYPQSDSLAAADQLFVLPTPQSAKYGCLFDCPSWNWDAEAMPSALAEEVGRLVGAPREDSPPLRLSISSDVVHAQGYRLSLDICGASIVARSETGLYYGLESLGALLIEVDGKRMAREAEIEDWPAFETRGLITGPVWSSQLGELRFNLLQFPGGRGALDPVRREEYLALIKDCRRQHARFLSHEGYKGCFWDEGEKLDFSEEGYRKLKDYYKVRFDLGARDFTVAFDDMEIGPGEGRAMAEKHAEACLVVYEYLKSLDPACAVIFCPVPYGGPTPDGAFVFSGYEEGRQYLEAIGAILPEDIPVYWTGRHVFSPEVDSVDADRFGAMIGRKPFFWDNDSLTWCDRLQAFHGRPNDFVDHVSGYVANICDRPETVSAALLPVLWSISDYLWNPHAYAPETSMQRVFTYLAGEQAAIAAEAWRAAGAARAKEPVPLPSEKVKEWKEALRRCRCAEFGEGMAQLIDGLPQE